MFTDRVRIKLIAGKGGDGVIAWRREKYIPKGGPYGGDGGHGGSVILRANTQIYSLDAYRNQRLLKAENGRPGGYNRCRGRSGQDLTIDVPCGTLVKDQATGELLCDLIEEGQTWVVCQGGKGGYGNDHFKSPTHQAPYICTPGTEGQEREVELELKLIADVGLVGFPNAGKSTIMQALTRVKSKIAAYPFTTLQPHLGFITRHGGSRIYIADIPGIIEGAHKNRGLGLEFLRHIERTKLLLIVLDGSHLEGRNAVEDFIVLRREMEAYSPELLTRPFLVVFNKMDTEESAEQLALFEAAHLVDKKQIFPTCACTGEGLEALIRRLSSMEAITS